MGSDRYTVDVAFHGGGTIEADSIEEAVQEAKSRDWNASGISSIHIENMDGSERRTLQEGDL